MTTILLSYSDKCRSITHDNAANQVKGIRISGFPSIRCCAHTIQLAINDSLSDCDKITALIQKCQRIVQYLKKSGPGMRILRKAPTSCGKEKLSLLQNIKTRWNSSFYL